MSEKYLRYVIAQHNSEPAPPEYMYYAGISHNMSKGTDDVALENCAKDQVMWDDDKRSARQLRSLSSTIRAFIALENLGFENLRLFKVTMNYEPVNTVEFRETVKKERVRDIMSKMDEKDTKYLKEIGVLDLTIVT